MENLKVYHYTNKHSLKKILHQGRIIPSAGFTEWEKPALWLSTNPHRENSASSIKKTSSGEFIKRSIHEINNLGIIRIQIDLSKTRIFNIVQFKNISRISTRNLKKLQDFALGCSSDINQWRVSFTPIRKEAWVKVEIFDEVLKKWSEFKIKKDFSKLQTNLLEIKNLVEFMDIEQREKLIRAMKLIYEKEFTPPHNISQG